MPKMHWQATPEALFDLGDGAAYGLEDIHARMEANVEDFWPYKAAAYYAPPPVEPEYRISFRARILGKAMWVGVTDAVRPFHEALAYDRGLVLAEGPPMAEEVTAHMDKTGGTLVEHFVQYVAKRAAVAPPHLGTVLAV